MKTLAEPYEIIDAPLWWHLRGLQETASGYGRRLNTGRVVKLPDGRTRRLYVTQFSNAGTAWILLDGERVVVR